MEGRHGQNHFPGRKAETGRVPLHVSQPVNAAKLEPKARCPDAHRGAPCTHHEPPALEEGGRRHRRARPGSSSATLGLQLRLRPRPQRRAAVAAACAILGGRAAAAQPLAHPDALERASRADLRARRGEARRGRGAPQRGYVFFQYIISKNIFLLQESFFEFHDCFESPLSACFKTRWGEISR